MHRTAYASACALASVACAIFILFASDEKSARADEPAPPSPPSASAAVAASMQCERAAEPGRVKCSIELHTTSTNRSIAWADVAIIDLPDFTSALKGRIGASDATTKEPTQQKWAFGLVAKKAGQGEAKARVRAVVCEQSNATKDAGSGPGGSGSGSGGASPSRCTSTTIDVKALVQVG